MWYLLLIGLIVVATVLTLHYTLLQVPEDNVRNVRHMQYMQVPVRMHSSRHIPLSRPPPSLDGIGCNIGDRILLTGQTGFGNNGIFEVATVDLWVRAEGTVLPGSLIWVQEGRKYGRTLWSSYKWEGKTMFRRALLDIVSSGKNSGKLVRDKHGRASWSDPMGNGVPRTSVHYHPPSAAGRYECRSVGEEGSWYSNTVHVDESGRIAWNPDLMVTSGSKSPKVTFHNGTFVSEGEIQWTRLS